MEKIISKNRKDIELYTFAKNQIFNKMKNEFPLDLDKELNMLTKENAKSKNININGYLYYMAKILLIRPYEKFSYYFYH